MGGLDCGKYETLFRQEIQGLLEFCIELEISNGNAAFVIVCFPGKSLVTENSLVGELESDRYFLYGRRYWTLWLIFGAHRFSGLLWAGALSFKSQKATGSTVAGQSLSRGIPMDYINSF